MTIIITPYRLGNFRHVTDVEDFLPSQGWSEYDSRIQIEDREFVLGVRFIPHLGAKPDSGVLLVRPKDFEQARDWVFDSDAIGKADKHTLLDLLNTLEDDETLYLHFTFAHFIPGL